MSEQSDHVIYTRNEWTTVPCFIDILKFLKTKEIKTVADIGANVGEVTKLFLEELPAIQKVYAFEPLTSNFNFLKDRFKHDQRVNCLKLGIYYGQLTAILKHNGGCGSSSITDGSIGLESIDLMEFEGLNHDIDLVKLDVEGAEYNIIKNSTKLQNTKYVIIEFHPFGMEDFEDFNSKLPAQPGTVQRTMYIKSYTDAYVKRYFPNHKWIVDDQVQYLLERNDA